MPAPVLPKNVSQAKSHDNGKLSRREFLDSGARNAAGVAAAGVGAITLADSADGKTRKTPVSLAIVGVRNRGLALAEQFASLEGVSVRALCDVDQNQLHAAREKLRLDLRCEQQLLTLLEDKLIDGFVVATPDHSHLRLAEQILEAGYDLYLESPVTHTIEESERLSALAKEHADQIIQTGLTFRSAPHVQTAIDFIRNGGIGRVHLAKAWATHKRRPIGHSRPASIPAGVDFASWCGDDKRAEFYPNRFHYNWRWFWDYGSGELGNWGVHLLDVALWGLNKEFPHRVSSTGGQLHFDDDQETPDTQQILFDFGNVTISWEHRQWSNHANEGRSAGVSFHGDKGTLILDRGGWKVYGQKNGPAQDGRDSTREHALEFVDAIRSRRSPNASIPTALPSTNLCHLGNLAYRNGRELVLS